MTPSLLVLLGCTAKYPSPGDGATTVPTDGGSSGTTPTEPTEPTEPTGRTHAYSCSAPPADAITFSGGTVHADQLFTQDEPQSMPAGWTLLVTGASYTHADSCETLVEDQALWRPIKEGDRVGDYLFEVMLTVPGTDKSAYLGEHADNGGHVANPSFSAHWSRIGWHDGDQYHWVDSLPHGWTNSTVCVGDVGVDYIYLTVLFDPRGGPYETNLRNPLSQPIWFDVEITATGVDPRSCFVTAWQKGMDLDALLGDEGR